jgi:hypothetical protein
MKGLTKEDWADLAETYAASVAEGCDCGKCTAAHPCRYEGEVVMTSIGYVALDADGEVRAFGRVLGNVGER